MPFDFVHILYGFDLQIYNKTIALHVLQQKNPPHFRKAEFSFYFHDALIL